ncbi:hypothetical protein TNCV_2104461 [Trichonephila clavipes]|nr:hypothetical protein TNCV_2104461 [Trichonephila clavipes]
MGLRRISMLLYVIDRMWHTPASGRDLAHLFYSHHARQITHHRTFFLWGNLKDLVHLDVVTTETDLVDRLYAACILGDNKLL